MDKKFIHNKTHYFQLSKIQIVAGVLAGLLFSFFFYLFLYVIREAIRLLSVTDDFDIWVLSGSEVSFYNLMYAFVAVILGQSVLFTFLFDRPSKAMGISSRIRNSILNDQRVLIWYFLFVAFQMAFFYGIWFGQASPGGFYIYSLYPRFNYIFILIIIVLYFQQWITLMKVYKRITVKWLVISIVSVTIVSFGLSKINPVNYKKINENFLKRNVFHNYNLHLPESDFYGFLEKRSLVEKIYVAFSKVNNVNELPLIIADNKEIPLDEIAGKIHFWQSKRDKWDAKFMIIALLADKDVKMNFINLLKGELVKAGINHISYGVVPPEHKFDERYYKNSYISMILKGFTNDPQEAEELFVHQRDTFGIQNIIDVVQMDDGRCMVNGTVTGQDRLKDIFMKLISQDPNCIVRFYINENVNFSSYLSVITALKEAAYDLRVLYIGENTTKKKRLRIRIVEIP